MKIGYPCINLSLESRSSHTFRLASYSEERLQATIEQNLFGLQELLDYNSKNNVLFLRLGSGIIPFASHPVNTFPWQTKYAAELQRLGTIAKQNNIRLSMHPDQFTLINSVSEEIFERTVRELLYHAEVLDLMEMDTTAKIQIHVGGVYGDKPESIRRFVRRYKLLPEQVKRRLAVEDDDRLYSIKDCLQIYKLTGIPVIYDSLHHQVLNNGESSREALLSVKKTWTEKDGIPITDYSQQEKGARIGNHAKTIDVEEFKNYIARVKDIDVDMMLEIKDKETSALKALTIVKDVNILNTR